MAAKFPAFLALLTTMTLLFSVAIHGCQPSCSNPATPPPPPPAVPTPSGATCPINTADLSVCVDLLGWNYVSSQQCCTLLQGLANTDAALCVCGVIKVLGVVIPVNVDVLLNECGKTCPPGSFTCPL
ncbi:hypothetical protein GQ55_7G050700 [Panicum hallii var. hallii]|uniref:Bifunctional inhibitor/plant lipid transfer protein/seed storage helical domain-containing protein n=2 Tax=Panicum hallii TaxID=206008 RepID=A0A2T7CSS5_9POAL|nr:hypothetical protein PAHAL_7G054700 [Panicum hallii]PUZ46293.1 hypothetical protein GQ55_7G050700 [Panicum hallii var. hallii]